MYPSVTHGMALPRCHASIPRRREFEPEAPTYRNPALRRPYQVSNRSGDLYVQGRYPSWPAGLARISLGFALVGLAREITARELAHFPRLAQAGAHISGRAPAKRSSMKMAHFAFPMGLRQSRRPRDPTNTPRM